jgi:hypothetical protein
MSLGDTVFFAGRSEEYGIKLPKLPKPKVMSPKDFGKALYKFSGAEGLVTSGKAISKCKPNDSKCIAKNLGELALSASGFVPGVGGAARAASIARTAAVTGVRAAATTAKAAKTAASAAKLGKAASGAAKAGKAAAKLAGKGAKMAGEAVLDAGGSVMDFAEDNAGALAGGAALLGTGALGAAAMSRMGGGGGGVEGAQGMAGGMPGGYGGMPGGYGGMPGGMPGGYGGMSGGYPYTPPASSAPVIVPPAPAAPAAQAPPIKINIQISGKDMAASSGAFGDEVIGKPLPPGRASVAEADAEEEAPSGGGAKAALIGLAKKHVAGDESFTLTGAPVKRGVNWFAVIFFVMCILVLFFTSR